MPFAATWMDLETTVLIELRQKNDTFHITLFIGGI